MSNLREKISKLYMRGRHGEFVSFLDEIIYLSAINDVLELPELKSAIEDAEKYDKLFEDLVVWDCPKCNGTGKISRPLTEEEKGEVAEHCINIFCRLFLQPRFGGYDYLTLKSGARVEVKK